MNQPVHPSARAPGGDRFLIGLIGAGIGGSLTPAMHEAEARAQGFHLHYQRIDLDRSKNGADALPELLNAAEVMAFAGLNITYPCKQAVLPLLDALSPDAQTMGAVNTVVLRDGRRIGHNTDGAGWRRAFERALPDADLSWVVLLGAGGAGSAIAHAVAAMGVQRLVIVDADRLRADALAAALRPRVQAIATTDAAQAMSGASGLIHATPTGMAKLPGLALDAALLKPSMWVSEIVYFPIETALLKAAREIGCRVSDGGGMAVGQAALAFELFTGRAADAARMQAHLRSLV